MKLDARERCAIADSSQPVVQGPSVWHVTVGQVFTATYTTTNADGSSVTLSATGLPDGASLNTTTGVVTWTPALTEPVFNARFASFSELSIMLKSALSEHAVAQLTTVISPIGESKACLRAELWPVNCKTK
jgi:hypothetical protein